MFNKIALSLFCALCLLLTGPVCATQHVLIVKGEDTSDQSQRIVAQIKESYASKYRAALNVREFGEEQAGELKQALEGLKECSNPNPMVLYLGLIKADESIAPSTLAFPNIRFLEVFHHPGPRTLSSWSTFGSTSYTQVEVARRAYKQSGVKLPEDKQFLAVVLARDEIDSYDGSKYLFPEYQAIALAKLVAKRLGDRHLLVANQLGTGKYDPRTGEEIVRPYKDLSLDPITTLFLEQLNKDGVTEAKRTLFYGREYDKPHNMDILYGALESKGCEQEIILPSGSAGHIYSCLESFPRFQVIAYLNRAMLDNMKSYVFGEFHAHRIRMINENFSEPEAARSSGFKPPEPTLGDKLAEYIYDFSRKELTALSSRPCVRRGIMG